MKQIIIYIGLVLTAVLHTTAANAVPTLYFDNANTDAVNYNATNSIMSVSADVFDTLDVTVPNLTGSSLDLSVSFTGLHPDTNPIVTVGSFTGVSGNDLTILDGIGNTLLTGDFQDPVTLRGANSTNFGQLNGTFIATGGSLSGIFGMGQVIALELNLTTAFGSTMFNNDFSGAVDGRVEAIEVPEPTMLILLGLGLVFMGFLKTPRRNS